MCTFLVRTFKADLVSSGVDSKLNRTPSVPLEGVLQAGATDGAYFPIGILQRRFTNMCHFHSTLVMSESILAARL